MRLAASVPQFDRAPATTQSSLPMLAFRKVTSHLPVGRQHRHSAPAMYRVTDRLHGERTAQVTAEGIAPIVSAWLAELGAHSPLVDDLARAARAGDWAVACAVGDQLSVDVALAA
jgi:hypothetical protein